MRIVTRPDFDGIVCAVLLSDALDINNPVEWVEPNAMQHGLVDVQPGDIIANLAYHDKCALWFDHHESNRIRGPFNGAFEITPSAARIIFDYYKTHENKENRFKRDYDRLVKEADKIDSAALSLDEVLHPENYPYAALSLTISSHNRADEPYWNRLVNLLGKSEIDKILKDPEVKRRIKAALEANKNYLEELKKHTVNHRHVTVTDFRSFNKTPTGSRFLVFSLFPESVANVKIRFDNSREKVIFSLGHSIFNRNCNVNVGHVCSVFGGGGHRGAGSCSVPLQQANETSTEILDILLKNYPSSFNILYEEPLFIAVEKPPEFLAAGGPGEETDTFCTAFSQYLWKQSGSKIDLNIVYSIDREASGIVLFAKKPRVKENIRENRDKTKKVYTALVEGHPPERSGPINKFNKYWELRKYNRYSLLEIEPEVDYESEDPHQLRAHLAQMGCPIVGDKKYGASANPLKRLGLHARFMAFTHPFSNKRIVLECPTPKTFLDPGVKKC